MTQPNYKQLASAEMAYLVITVRMKFNGWDRRDNIPFEQKYVINGNPNNIKAQFKQLKRNEVQFMRERYPETFGSNSGPRYTLFQVIQAKLYTLGRVQKLHVCEPIGCCCFRFH